MGTWAAAVAMESKAHLSHQLGNNEERIGKYFVNKNVNRDEFHLITSEFLPPPEPILPKIIAPNEPLRTGGPTPFL